MKIDWPNWIEQQDQKIRQAKGASVRAELRKLNLKKIPRRYLSDISDLARRLNLSYLMLRILTPVVRSETTTSPDVREATLYAVALARIGAHGESSSMLEKIESSSKEILLLKGSALQAQWSYGAAKKVYQQVVKFKDLSEREKILARLNLSLCQIYLGQFKETIASASEFEGLKKSYPLLYGNSRELISQAYLGLGRFDDAEKAIRESIEILDAGADDYSLIAKKWLLVIRASREEVSEQEWLDLGAQAQGTGDFETLRDLDLHRALLTKDRSRFLKVFFGTPFPSFRKKAHKKFGGSVPRKFEFGGNETSDKILVQDGVFLRGKDKIRFTLGQRRVLIALTRDFYRPIPIGELFSALYADERFSIYSSPHRVEQNVQNLRKFFKEKQIPIHIHLKKRSYSIDAPNVKIEVQNKYKAIAADLWELKDWLTHLDQKSFGRRDVEKQFVVSRARANELLKQAEVEKLIRKASAGNKSIYVVQPKAKVVSK